jgi:hypothetical protein
VIPSWRRTIVGTGKMRTRERRQTESLAAGAPALGQAPVEAKLVRLTPGLFVYLDTPIWPTRCTCSSGEPRKVG